jgi:hypothetical protein
LQAAVLSAVSGDSAASAWVWRCWSGLSWAWLLSVCCELVVGAMNKPNRSHLLLELLSLAALYAVLSPLMAFAIFFGLHHAAGHIQRVMACTPQPLRHRLHRQPHVIAALAVSVLLAALLVLAFINTLGASRWLDTLALRTVVLALVAVSVPHVVLISAWAKRLNVTRA